MPYLKTGAPPEIIRALRSAEDQADECWRTLDLRHYPWNVGIWSLLTGGVRIVEREQAARGSNTPHFDAMLNVLSRLLAVGVKWATMHGQAANADLGRRWTGELSAVAEQALELAKEYSHFETCFQGFHAGR